MELERVEQAWKDDGQFAILHDLTNCLRIGDVTVFPDDGTPETIEIGSKRHSRSRGQRRRVKAAHEAAGYPSSIAGANAGVEDVFVLLPDQTRGRSNPFVDLGSDYRWGQVENSGRKTVWNTGTRNGAQTVLFNQDHFGNGLRPNAIDVMLHNLSRRR